MAESGTALAVRTKKGIAADLASYAGLLKLVRETFQLGQQQAEGALLWTQWNTGWYIQTHILLNKARAPYGEKVVMKLARDLEKSNTALKRCRQIYRKLPKFFPAPIGPRGGQSSLTHDIAKGYPLPTPLTINQVELLITVKDSRQRYQLLDQAARHKWSVRELERRVRAANEKSKSGKNNKRKEKPKPGLLVPRKGKVGIFRITEEFGRLQLDRGFTSYQELTEEQAKSFKAGDLVQFPPLTPPLSPLGRGKGEGWLVKAENAAEADLFTYECDLGKVVDADTHWLRIWIERPQWLKEKLRLRGIDAFEMKTAKGRAAKRFVEKLMKQAVKIVVTTTKPDKWDRYLADIFLTMPDPARSKSAGEGSHGAAGKEIFLNNLLLEKGCAVPKDDFRLNDWEKGGGL